MSLLFLFLRSHTDAVTLAALAWRMQCAEESTTDDPLIVVARMAVVCSRSSRRAIFFSDGIARRPYLESVKEVAPCILTAACTCVCVLGGVDRNTVDCVRAGGAGQGIFRGELRGQPVATRPACT